jgi:hypothetical protein
MLATLVSCPLQAGHPVTTGEDFTCGVLDRPVKPGDDIGEEIDEFANRRS